MSNGQFKPGHKKTAGRKKGSLNKTTVWVLEALKKRGYNYEKELVDALQKRDFDMVDRLIKLAPHIANRPTEHVGMEGVETLVIKEYVEPDKK